MINLGLNNKVEVRIPRSHTTAIFQIQHNGSTVFSPTGFDCNAVTGFLHHRFLFLCHLSIIFERCDFGHWLCLARHLDTSCMLSLQSNTACSKKLEDRFFSNWRIWKEQKTSESCSCKYSLTSFLCLRVPRKGGPKLHTILHVFNRRILYFVKVFGDAQNLHCVLTQLI